MRCVANYEVRSECSVVSDDDRLEIKHPKALYRALIKNIPRQDYSTPFLLSVHVYFDAPSLNEAEDVAEERLVDCLNMLAFATGGSFARHRIKQIVDCSPESGMRSVLFWGNAIEHEDPHPYLDKGATAVIERLSEFDVPPAIRRAMRWYRLGVNANVPDDQFQYFWFALEIIAEHHKPSDKVPDKCPQCQAPLYCKACDTHPVHRPYPKQAIRALLEAVDKGTDDKNFQRLDKTRNGLMHGATLKEIEAELPKEEKHVVDTLGHLVLKALAYQFPQEWFDRLSFGVPNTYIHRKVSGIVHLETIVPKDAEGNLDLRFTGTKVEMVSDAPPQSGRPSVMVMTDEQYQRLRKLAHQPGDHHEMCRRIVERARFAKDGRVGCLVAATDMARIKQVLARGETGSWQDLFREVIGNQPKPPAGPAG